MFQSGSEKYVWIWVNSNNSLTWNLKQDYIGIIPITNIY